MDVLIREVPWLLSISIIDRFWCGQKIIIIDNLVADPAGLLGVFWQIYRSKIPTIIIPEVTA